MKTNHTKDEHTIEKEKALKNHPDLDTLNIEVIPNTKDEQIIC